MRRLVFYLLTCAAFLLTFTPVSAAPRVVHVFVALCDNANQGIVPVPAHLGRGDSPSTNLYWGAAFGVRTYFRKHADWEEVFVGAGPKREILQRVVFRHRTQDVFIVADAYNGAAMRATIDDFLRAVAGHGAERVTFTHAQKQTHVEAGGAAALHVFVGHNGLMDFTLTSLPTANATQSQKRETVILACASKPYFQRAVQSAGAQPLLWTTGLMAPEAYSLAAALTGWITGESPQEIRTRAATVYCRYQKCSQRAGLRLFATGW